MHVLLVDLGLQLQCGQQQVLSIARLLSRTPNIIPLVACPKASALARVLAEEGLAVLPLPGNNPRNPVLLCLIELALRKHSTSIMHVHGVQATKVGAFFKWLHPKTLRVVITRRTPLDVTQRFGLKSYLKANAVACPTREIAAQIKQLNVHDPKIYTIPFGLDVERYTRQKPRNDNRFIFLGMGDLTPEQGFSVLVQAMAVINEMEDLPVWEVRIAGAGPLFQKLLDEARELGVESHLALLDEQPHENVLPLCDAVILPTLEGKQEHLGIAEAWCTGLPLVCSTLSSYLEKVKDKDNALTTPTGNPVALAAAMVRCMVEPLLRERLIASGQKSLPPYTDLVMVKETVRMYYRVEASSLVTHSELGPLETALKAREALTPSETLAAETPAAEPLAAETLTAEPLAAGILAVDLSTPTASPSETPAVSAPAAKTEATQTEATKTKAKTP